MKQPALSPKENEKERRCCLLPQSRTSQSNRKNCLDCHQTHSKIVFFLFKWFTMMITGIQTKNIIRNKNNFTPVNSVCTRNSLFSLSVGILLFLRTSLKFLQQHEILDTIIQKKNSSLNPKWQQNFKYLGAADFLKYFH